MGITNSWRFMPEPKAQRKVVGRSHEIARNRWAAEIDHERDENFEKGEMQIQTAKE